MSLCVQYLSNCPVDPMNRPLTAMMVRVAKRFLVNPQQTGAACDLTMAFRLVADILYRNPLLQPLICTQLRQMCDLVLQGLHEEAR